MNIKQRLQALTDKYKKVKDPTPERFDRMKRTAQAAKEAAKQAKSEKV